MTEIVKREKERIAAAWEELVSSAPGSDYEGVIERHLLQARAEQIREDSELLLHSGVGPGHTEFCSLCKTEKRATALEEAAKGGK